MTYPFCDIWARDTSEHKAVALAEIAFIEFMSSPKKTNPFYGYSDALPKPPPPPAEGEPLQIADHTVIVLSERAKKIIANRFKEWPNWSPDNLVWEAIEQYKEFYYNASPNLAYYESNLKAAAKVRDFFDTFDMGERNFKTGMPIYKAKEITDAIKNADEVMTKLSAMKAKVDEDIYEQSKSRKNRQINPFER